MRNRSDEVAGTGLRERKKARTRAEIQRHALRLFRERGYEATTVSQIAAAAEVSDRTFFRYFPTKEAVVLYDELDPRVFEAFEAQPAELSPVQALRGAIREVLGQVSEADQANLRERVSLLLSVPPLRATLLDGLRGPVRGLAEAIAARTGRASDDPAVRALAGAMMGVGLSAMFAAAEQANADMIALVDEGLEQLEAGFPL